MSSHIDVSSSTDEYFRVSGFISGDESDSDNEYEIKESLRKEFEDEYRKTYGKEFTPAQIPPEILQRLGDVTNLPVVFNYTPSEDEEACIRRDELEELSKPTRYRKFSTDL